MQNNNLIENISEYNMRLYLEVWTPRLVVV